MNKTSRFSLIAALILCLSFAFGQNALAGEKVLRVASPWGPKTLDIQKDGYLMMRLGITEGLTCLDTHLKIQPGLAESWTVSDDKLTWTFKIRSGVLFHDGTPLTAGIVADTLKRLQKTGSLLKRVPLDSIQAPDDGTLIIKTSAPFAPLPAYLSKGETAPLAPSSYDAQGDVVKVVATGPFKFESWQPKAKVVTLANHEYWGDSKAKVDKVVFTCAPEAMTRLTMIQAGELDIVQLMPPDAAKSLTADPQFSLHSMPIGRCRVLSLNLDKAPFNDIQIRKAINLAVNRQDLTDYVLEGFGDPAVTLFPGILFWSNTTLSPYAFDPAKAKSLLAEAGWKDTDKDGVLDKNGQNLVVKLVTYPERAELPPMAEVIQNELAQVGIKVELTVLQTDAANQMRNSGNFDMNLVGRGLFFVPDPDEVLMSDYYSENTFKDGWGAYHYKNPRVDELLTAARAEFDTNKRKALYDEVQKILLDETPVVNLNYYVNVDVTSARVKGYEMHPNEQSYMLERVELP